MANDNKKGITVKVDAELHAQVKAFIEANGMTMAEFVAKALDDELHPKIQIKEDKSMENMRTLAFQVPESLFQQIKDYLRRNNMTQKEFVIGLVKTEIERDLTARQALDEERNQSAALADSQHDDDPAENMTDAYDQPYEDEQHEMDESEDEEEFEDEEESEDIRDNEDEEETDDLAEEDDAVLDNEFENEQGDDAELITDDPEPSDDTEVEDTIDEDESEGEEADLDTADLDETEGGSELEADPEDAEFEDGEAEGEDFEEYEAYAEEMSMGMGMGM